MKKIGYIGLGNMGKLMSGRLLEKGYDVTVYDIVSTAVQEMVNKGAHGAQNAQEAAKAADVVFVMVNNFAQASKVCFGVNGVIAAMKPGSVLVVNSTVAPSDIRSVEAEALKVGVRVVDAPVSGSKERAADGSLVLITACSDDVFEDVKDILYTVGSNTIHVGKEVGMGQTVKAANQLLSSAHTALTGEAMVLAQKAGVNPEILLDVISKSMGCSNVFVLKAPQLMDRDFETRGALDINIKDMKICKRMGEELGVPLYLNEVTLKLFEKARDKGYGKEDFCAVAKIYEQEANCEIRRLKSV